MHRRIFLTLGTASALGALTSRVGAQAPAPAAGAEPQAPAGASSAAPADGVPRGMYRLHLTNAEPDPDSDDPVREGVLYIPKAYDPETPMPLVVMLHGFAGSGERMKYMWPLAEELGLLILAPDSRSMTWGQSNPGFDADVKYISPAYKWVTQRLNIDPARVALGGVSDGAGYALSMGLAYGEVFNHLLVFAGGTMLPFRREGKPLVYFAHGTNDHQMPIDRTARRFAPELKAQGYDVTLREYEGGHGAPLAIVREAFEWLLKTPVK